MRLSMSLASGIISLMTCALSGQASGHVVFTPNQSHPKAYFAGTLRVSHGCAGSPTTSLRVEVPAGVTSAKPQPKPGWVISIEHVPLDKPVTGEGGQIITKRVTAITWTGHLPDDQYDEFGLFLRLPDAAGPLYFPVTQTCETGVNLWRDLPQDQPTDRSKARPAPVLTLVPAESATDMPGKDMSHMSH